MGGTADAHGKDGMAVGKAGAVVETRAAERRLYEVWVEEEVVAMVVVVARGSHSLEILDASLIPRKLSSTPTFFSPKENKQIIIFE